MKHIFGKLAAFFVITGIFLSSCSDIAESGEEKSNGGAAKISVSLGLKSLDGAETLDEGSSRTVVAKSDDNKALTTLTDISLYAKISTASAELGSSDTLLTSWESYSAMQTSPFSEDLKAGTYDFMLTAKNYGATLAQTISGRTLSAGSSTALNFSSLAPSESGEQTGGIELNLHYHPSNYVTTEFKKYVATSPTYFALSISLDGTVVATKDSTKYNISTAASSYSSELSPDENGNKYSIDWTTAKFQKDSISAGFHIVTFTFTAPDSSVFVYPIPVYVQAGYLSKEEIYPFSSPKSAAQDANATSYTITYNSNTTAASTATQTFYEGSSIADAEALGFSSDTTSKRFKEWNTAKNGSGTAYKAGDTPALTGDTTLYAQWAEFTKVTYLINLETENNYGQTVARTETYIQQYETGSSLVATATAFAGADLTYSSKTKSSYENYTFCGWDTQADGSGTRYAAGATPALSEDTILYAQWCGAKMTSTNTSWIYYGYYEVYDVKQWNALMGSPFANTTRGTVSASALIRSASSSSNSVTISPALKHTSEKTFSGKILGFTSTTFTGLSGVLFNEIADGAEIQSINLRGPLCNTNRGTIKSVTVSGSTMTGYSAIAKVNAFTGTISNCTVSNCTITGAKEKTTDVGYVGAVCNENYNKIENCKVTDCTVDGKTNSVMYTGGITGYNGENATISGTTNLYGVGNTQVTGTVKGKSSGESYAGGYTGYNAGKIEGAGSVNIALTGSDDESGYYGYVIGENKTNAVNGDSATNPVSADITVVGLDGTEILNKSAEELAHGETQPYEAFKVNKNTKVNFYLKDSSGGSKTNKETLKLLDADGNTVKTFVSSGTPNVDTYVYLNKGTYKLTRYNGNTTYKSQMNIKIITY